MSSAYRRKFREVKTLAVQSLGESLLLTSLDDDKRCIGRKINLKRLSEKDRRAVILEVNLLRKLHRPNLVGYLESFMDETEVVIVLEAADWNPGSPQESISTVEELKEELEAVYQRSSESDKVAKRLQAESEVWKEKYQGVLMEVQRLKTEKSALEERGKDLVSLVERQLVGWIGEFTGKAGSWAGSKATFIPPKHPETHNSALRERGRLPTSSTSQARTSSQPSKTPRISSISLAFDSSTPLTQSVRERLSSLRESKLSLESQLKQLQLDMSANDTLSSAEL